MKRIIIILVSVLSFVFVGKAQFTNTTNSGSSTTLLQSLGGYKGKLGLILPDVITDTTTANTMALAAYNGSLIITSSGGYKLWYRTLAPNTWNLFATGTIPSTFNPIQGFGLLLTGTYPNITFKADTSHNNQGLMTWSDGTRRFDSLGATIPVQFNLSVNSPIGKSGTYPNITVFADTGRSNGQLVTGGSLNKVKDSITSIGYKLNSDSLFNTGYLSRVHGKWMIDSLGGLVLHISDTSGQFIRNQTGVQPGSNFNISGNGVIGGVAAIGGAPIVSTTGLNMNSVSGTLGRGIDVQISGTSSDANYSYIGVTVGAATGKNYGIFLRAENSSAGNEAIHTESGSTYLGGMPTGTAGTDSIIVKQLGILKAISPNYYLKVLDSANMLAQYVRIAGYGLTKGTQSLTVDTLLIVPYTDTLKANGIATKSDIRNSPSGTVTSIATNNGTGISGGTITNTGTLVIDTVNLSTRLWRQKGIDSINGLLALKLNISDTAAMLNGYARSGNLSQYWKDSTGYLVPATGYGGRSLRNYANFLLDGKLVFAGGTISDATIINMSGGSTGYSKGIDINILPTTSDNRGVSVGIGGVTSGTNNAFYASASGARYNYSYYSNRGNQRFTDTTFMPDSGRIVIGTNGYSSTNTAVQVSRIVNDTTFPSNSAHAFSDYSTFNVSNAPYNSYDVATRFGYNGGIGSPHDHDIGFQFAPTTVSDSVYFNRVVALYSKPHLTLGRVITYAATVYQDYSDLTVPRNMNFLAKSIDTAGGGSRIETTGAITTSDSLKSSILDVSGKSFLRTMSNGSTSDSVVTVVNGEIKKVAQSSISGGSVANALSIAAELISGGATSYNGSVAKSIAIQPTSVTNAMIANSTINLTTKVTGVLPIANGGTGSATQNFVDLTTNQSIAGNKTFSGYMAFTSNPSLIPGSLGANSTYGIGFYGRAGSLADFGLVNSLGNEVYRNNTGTVNSVFAGTVTASLTAYTTPTSFMTESSGTLGKSTSAQMKTALGYYTSGDNAALTLTTAAQPNITSVGGLIGLTVTAGRLKLGGNASDAQAVMLVGDATYPTAKIVAPNTGGTVSIFGESGTGLTVNTDGTLQAPSNTYSSGGYDFIVRNQGTGAFEKAATSYVPPIVLADWTSDTQNSGTSETDLFTYTTAASSLTATGAKLIGTYSGTFNDLTATTTLKMYFAGTLIGNTGALTVSATGGWSVSITLIRTGSSTARSLVNVTTPGASTAVYTSETDITGITWTNTNIIKVTGTAGGASGGSSDITAKLGTLIQWPPAVSIVN